MNMQGGVIPQTGEKEATDIVVGGKAGVIYIKRYIVPHEFTVQHIQIRQDTKQRQQQISEQGVLTCHAV